VSQYVEYVVNFCYYCSHIYAEFWIQCYKLLIKIKIDQRLFSTGITICQDALEVTSRVTEQTQSRYFKLYLAKCLLGLGDIPKAKQTLESLVQENENYIYERNDIALHANCLVELACIEKYEMVSNLTTRWLELLNGTVETKSEILYKQAEKTLEQFLYNNGLFVHADEQFLSKYIRRDEVSLLLRVKIEIGSLLLLRGQSSEAQEKLKKLTLLFTRCCNPSGHAIAQQNYYLGRAHSHMINTPISVEAKWGWRKQQVLEVTEELLNNPKADLLFLPAMAAPNKGIDVEYTRGLHDYVLIRSCLMEIVYLYGCKLVKDDDDETTAVHSALASLYLYASGNVSNLRRKFYKDLLVKARASEPFKKAPPTFACEAIIRSFNEQNKLQKMFVSRISPLASNQTGKSRPSSVTKQPKTASDSVDENTIVTNALNIINYYMDLLKELELTSGNFADRLEEKVVIMHRYLIEEYPLYAAEFLMLGVPDTKRLPKYGAGTVCMQFYAIDDGHTPVFKPDTSKKIRPDPAQLDKLPLVSLFYAIPRAIAANDLSASVSGTPTAKKALAKKMDFNATPASQEIPFHAMISLEQLKVQEVHNQIRDLLSYMTRHNANTFTQEVEQTMDDKKKTTTAKPKTADASRPTSSQSQKGTINTTTTAAATSIVTSTTHPIDLELLKEKKTKVLSAIASLLKNPASPPRQEILLIPVSEIENFITTRSDVSHLLDLFDMYNGGALVQNEKIAKMLRKIFDIEQIYL
jgi:tetratricopeptide (TPR) repeat protein